MRGPFQVEPVLCYEGHAPNRNFYRHNLYRCIDDKAFLENQRARSMDTRVKVFLETSAQEGRFSLCVQQHSLRNLKLVFQRMLLHTQTESTFLADVS